MGIFKKPQFNLRDLSQNQKDDIIEALSKGKSICYHGGCVACVVRISGEINTLAGMEYCSGCEFTNLGNRSLKDKSLNVLLPPGGWSAAQVDNYLEGQARGA